VWRVPIPITQHPAPSTLYRAAGLAGCYLAYSDAWLNMPAESINMYLWELLAFCAVAFAAAPLGLRLRLGKDKTLHISALPAAAFGSALCLGPVYAPLPAFFAVLGRMTFSGVGSARFSHIIAACFRLPIVAAASAGVYILLGAIPDAFPARQTLLPAAGALVAFVLFDRAAARLFKGSAIERADSPESGGALGFAETALAAVAGLGLAAYRGFLPAYWLIPLPLVALVAHATALSLAGRRAAKAQHESSAETETPKAINFIDPLTGLANERYVTMFLDQEIGRSTRNNYPLSLIMLDIDNFKQLNEELGREACDRVLSEIAAGMRALVRDYDVVARYASDEFVIILPEAMGHDAFDTAERMRGAVAGYSPDWLGDKVEISVSGGVASFPDHGVTADDLINSAHHALNRAKFAGRNRVISCYELAKRAA